MVNVMNWSIIFNLFIAHILSDYYVQCAWLCEKKQLDKFPYKYNLFHAVIVFLISWLCVFTSQAWWLSLGIALVHFVIDVIKSVCLEHKYKDKSNALFWVFIGDQVLHLLAICGISVLWLRYNAWNQFEFLKMIGPKYLLLFVAFLLACKPANIVVKKVLEFYEVKTPPHNNNEMKKSISNSNNGSEHGTFHSGSLIGSMERILIIVLVVLSQYEAIGFLIAAKSILRFSETSGSEKSEYVVAGTFLSFAIALILGLLVLKLSTCGILFFG